MSDLFEDLVNNQPTAYDVDKVVERLEVDCQYTEHSMETYEYAWNAAMDTAIEIVKEGGVSENR